MFRFTGRIPKVTVEFREPKPAENADESAVRGEAADKIPLSD
jgi:hypothetical protein